MSFDPRQKMVVNAEGDKLFISCPIWANDLLNGIPSKRWNKSKRAWQVTIIRQNVEAVRELIKMAGVVLEPEAEKVMTAYDRKIKDMGKRGAGFPAWYKFKTQPRKHQADAYPKLYGLKAGAIFFDMQTGKSKTAVDLCAAHRMEGHIEAILILVKRTLRRNWIEQFEHHCPLPVSILLPNTDNVPKFERWLNHKHDFKVMIVGWESLSAGGMATLCERFVNTHKCAIIGDETTYIASHKATRTEIAIKLARQCEYRYALTGTPALEGPMNLYSQFEFLDPEIIGISDFLAFRNRYAVMGGYQREIRPGKKVATEIIGYQNLEELMNLIGPHSVQVLKREAYDLPDKRPEVRTVELTKEQRKLYDEVKREGTLTVKGSPAMILDNVLGVMLRLHQIAGGYAVKSWEKKYIGRDKDGRPAPKVKIMYDPVEIIPPEKNPKMIELCEFVEEWRGKKQGMIWAVYMSEIEAIVKLMKHMGLKVSELHGKIDDRIRQSRHVNPFKAGETDVLVGNASTGGMGYTMMNAEVNCFYNNTFKAIDRVQAEERNYGDGQTVGPIVCDIVAERTVDGTVLAALAEKLDLSDYVKHRISEVTRLLDGDVK